MASTPDIALILGMHRSGTSCLAGCLEQLGLDLGGHGTGGSSANARGNRENRAIVILHENILRHNNGSWDRPPPTLTWEPRHIQRAQDLLLAYPPSSLIGIKDPRTLLHLDHWLALPYRFRFAAIVRHPLSVAHSLQRRDNMPISQGLSLWRHYNTRLLALCHSQPVSLFSFDWPEEQFTAQLRAVAQQWCLPAANEPLDFYLQELRSADASPQESLPGDIAEIYQKLLALLP